VQRREWVGIQKDVGASVVASLRAQLKEYTSAAFAAVENQMAVVFDCVPHLNEASAILSEAETALLAGGPPLPAAGREGVAKGPLEKRTSSTQFTNTVALIKDGMRQEDAELVARTVAELAKDYGEKRGGVSYLPEAAVDALLGFGSHAKGDTKRFNELRSRFKAWRGVGDNYVRDVSVEVFRSFLYVLTNTNVRRMEATKGWATLPIPESVMHPEKRVSDVLAKVSELLADADLFQAAWGGFEVQLLPAGVTGSKAAHLYKVRPSGGLQSVVGGEQMALALFELNRFLVYTLRTRLSGFAGGKEAWDSMVRKLESTTAIPEHLDIHTLLERLYTAGGEYKVGKKLSVAAGVAVVDLAFNAIGGGGGKPPSGGSGGTPPPRPARRWTVAVYDPARPAGSGGSVKKLLLGVNTNFQSGFTRPGEEPRCQGCGLSGHALTDKRGSGGLTVVCPAVLKALRVHHQHIPGYDVNTGVLPPVEQWPARFCTTGKIPYPGEAPTVCGEVAMKA
jgi:hypothetical protein